MMKALFATVLFLAFGWLPAAAQAPFSVVSGGFQEDGMLPSIYAYAGNDGAGLPCGGEDVSPPLAWTNVPLGTRSFGLIVFDPDGGQGEGMVHWVAVGIPASTTSIAQGAQNAQSAGLRAGATTDGTLAYRGFCPPRGDSDHHYVMTVYALDLAPDAVPSGLTRAALLDAINGHIIRATSIIGRYRR